MLESLSVHFLPVLVADADLAGATVVVIDVLRATTTITYALANGAREVIPCLEVDEARRIAAGLPAGQALLGGERDGVRIEGFELGNSPSEFTPAAVADRTVVFTTTNGTRAMNVCRGAKTALLGAFVNLSALVERLPSDGALHLLCSGTKGEVTREDVLLAGAVVARLRTAGAIDETPLNDQARIAEAVWVEAMEATGAPVTPQRLTTELRSSQGGHNLTRLKLTDDIDDAAELDRFDIVAELDVAAWRIVTAK